MLQRNKDKRDMKELPVTALDFEECKEAFPDIVSDTMMCVDSSSKYMNGFCDVRMLIRHYLLQIMILRKLLFC